MSKKHYDIDWLITSHDKNMAIGQRIDFQIKTSRSTQQNYLQELNTGVYMLTVAHNVSNSLDIKKIADKVQYSILSDRHNNQIIIRLSYNQLRNICYHDSLCDWAKFVAEQEISSRIHILFFYHLDTLNMLLDNYLENTSLAIKERLSNRHLVITNNYYNYIFDTTKIIALSLWRENNLEAIIKSCLESLSQKFEFFPQLLSALSLVFNNYSWELSKGKLKYSYNGIIKYFDYAALTDDLFYAHEHTNIESYLKNFNLEDLDCALTHFPTTSVRSLVHLKARPDTLSSLQNGFVLCAALENKGKQKQALTTNNCSPLVFSHWLRRSARYLSRHHYEARVIFGENNAAKVFSIVGEQVASIAIFPELIKGLLEQLSINYNNSVRLIAHNQDTLTIASEYATWSEINSASQKASMLFKMIAPDGTDPLSLFEQVIIPPHGAGTFNLSVVPDEYFELIDTVFSMKHTMAPGHDHYLLGLSYECLQEWGLAIAEFQKALRKDSHDSGILSALGCALMEAGQPESALPFLKKAYDARPDDADLANNLGRIQLLCGNTSEAIGAFERAVKLSPASAHFLANLGGVYLEAARTMDAIAMLNKALRCDPSYATAHEMLAQLYLQNGDEQRARQHALLAYQENPEDANIANLLWRLTVGKKSSKG